MSFLNFCYDLLATKKRENITKVKKNLAFQKTFTRKVIFFFLWPDILCYLFNTSLILSLPPWIKKKFSFRHCLIIIAARYLPCYITKEPYKRDLLIRTFSAMSENLLGRKSPVLFLSPFHFSFHFTGISTPQKKEGD